MKKFITICAWCPDSEEITKQEIQKGSVVSHGICKHYRDKIIKELENKRKKR